MRTESLHAGGAGARFTLVVFLLDGRRYGLVLAATERVLPMVAVSPLPGAPDVVLGVIDLHGEVVPVFDLRRRLALPAVDYGPAARLVIARTTRRRVAVAVDDVPGVVEVVGDSIIDPDAVVPGIGHVAGIAALADGILLIHDLDSFLSIDEERQLSNSLNQEAREALE